MVLIISFTGCVSNKVTSTPNASFSAKDAIKIEDIHWEVTGGVLDGERFISFNHTNNSKYTIMDIELEFKQKDGTSDEQLAIFDELKTTYDWSDEVPFGLNPINVNARDSIIVVVQHYLLEKQFYSL